MINISAKLRSKVRAREQAKTAELSSARTHNLVKFIQEVGVKVAGAVLSNPEYLKHCVHPSFATQFVVAKDGVTVYGPNGAVYVFTVAPGSDEVTAVRKASLHALRT